MAVLKAVNLALPHCVQEAQPDYYNRTATVALTTATREYTLPTVDADGATIRIKDIYGTRCFRVDGSEIPLRQVNYSHFIKNTRDYNLDTQGVPSMFALWGKANKMYLNYIPSESYTLTLYVEVYPNSVSSTELQKPLPLDDQWIIVAEAYATQYLYLKLQQVDMYRFWHQMYLDQKASISRMENQKQSKGISMCAGSGCVTDPLLDPFVGSWN